MAKRKSNTVVDVIFTVIFMLFMLGAIGGLVVWLARSEGLTVYVQYGENRYKTNSVNTSLGNLESGLHKFIVGSLTGETVDYSVEITPNNKTTFDFVTGDKRYKWSAVDCSNFFSLEQQKNGFNMTVTDEMTITFLLQSKYGDEILYGNAVEDVADYFVLTVKTSYGSVSMPFGLPIGEKRYVDGIVDNVADGITLTPNSIVF